MILTKIDSIIIIKNNFEIIAISKIDAIIITMMFIKLMRIIMTFVFIIIIIIIFKHKNTPILLIFYYFMLFDTEKNSLKKLTIIFMLISVAIRYER